MPQQLIEGFWGRHFKPAPLRERIGLNHVHATNRTLLGDLLQKFQESAVSRVVPAPRWSNGNGANFRTDDRFGIGIQTTSQWVQHGDRLVFTRACRKNGVRGLPQARPNRLQRNQSATMDA